VVAVLAQPWIVCLPALAAGLFLTANLSRFGMAGDIIAVAVAVPVLMVLMFACMRLLNRDVDHAFRKVKGAAIRRFRA
jgi:hypothetical protein